MDNKEKSRIEVLAPAGSMENLMTAIKAGCDAVYFGVEQLNMRARSTNNFTVEDLDEIGRLAKEHAIRTYLTLNTVLYDHDIRLMQRIIDAAKEKGIDAVIASDHAAMAYARKIGMPVHISTQCNVSNIETVEFYSLFADVIVLARELTLSQVAFIVNEIKRRDLRGPSGNLIRIEIFAHGALCMAVSGKCYLSLHSHNASANRGACIQNCRKSYIVTDAEEGTELEIDNEYIMSAKDLCTIDFLDKILEAGVQVLKIEGRGRSADYVHTTTQCYKEAVASIQDGSYSVEKIEAWKKRLATVYNRGFWEGYYLGRTMGEWSNTYGSQATKKRILIGKGVKYFAQAGIAEFEIESQTLKQGNQIQVTGPTTGFMELVVEELFVNGAPAAEAQKGDRVTIKLDQRIRPSDKLFKVVEA